MLLDELAPGLINFVIPTIFNKLQLGIIII